jgi:secretion/DNA translocation related TadE-like protein
MRAAVRDRIRDETGAGGVLALAIVAMTLVCALAALGLASALAARQRVVAAADASALAAADTLLGVVPGDPCALAAEVAAARLVALADCECEGAEARVTIAATWFGLPIAGESRAGPAP